MSRASAAGAPWTSKEGLRLDLGCIHTYLPTECAEYVATFVLFRVELCFLTRTHTGRYCVHRYTWLGFVRVKVVVSARVSSLGVETLPPASSPCPDGSNTGKRMRAFRARYSRPHALQVVAAEGWLAVEPSDGVCASAVAGGGLEMDGTDARMEPTARRAGTIGLRCLALVSFSPPRSVSATVRFWGESCAW